jgi:SAM-dependent methyltransferase
MNSQKLIWQHFQNTDHDSFAAAYPRLNFLLNRISQHHSAGAPAVLNIGVGGGYFEQQAKGRGWRISAVDPDEQAIARLFEKGIDAHVGTLRALPIPDQSMDFVVVSEVLEHLPAEELPTALSEIHRVLKPGGHFLGTVPHAEVLSDQQTVCPHCGALFHRWGHSQSFTIAQMRAVLSERFKVQRVARSAFVSLRRGPFGFVKGLLRKALAKMGEPIAQGNIWWIARKAQ